MICVRDFPHGEVSVKVNVIEFGHKCTQVRSTLMHELSLADFFNHCE